MLPLSIHALLNFGNLECFLTFTSALTFTHGHALCDLVQGPCPCIIGLFLGFVCTMFFFFFTEEGFVCTMWSLSFSDLTFRKRVLEILKTDRTLRPNFPFLISCKTFPDSHLTEYMPPNPFVCMLWFDRSGLQWKKDTCMNFIVERSRKQWGRWTACHTRDEEKDKENRKRMKGEKNQRITQYSCNTSVYLCIEIDFPMVLPWCTFPLHMHLETIVL